MMKKLFLFAPVVLLLFLYQASASMLEIPKGILSIESEAFSDIGPVSYTYIPETVTDISPDTFSSDDLIVYGHPGSAAEAFAAETGRTFVSVAITDLALISDSWAAPDQPFTLSASAVSTIWPMEYRFKILKNGNLITDSGESVASNCQFILSESGVYDVMVEISHMWDEERALFPAALTVEEHVRLNPESLEIGIGETARITSDDEWRTVTAASSNPSVLMANGTMITGVSTGYATVTLTAVQPEGVVITRCEVWVYVPVQEIVITHAPEKIFIGQTDFISAYALPRNAAYPQISITSDNEGVISVNENGLLTAVSQGEASIRISADRMETILSVKAAVPVSTVRIYAENEDILYTKGTKQLFAECLPPESDDHGVTWESSNTSVLKVNADGVITGVSAGDAVIIATAKDGSGAFCTYPVTVKRGVDSVTLSAEKTYLYPDEGLQLSYTVSPSTAGGKTLTWRSSDPTIATVSQSGYIRAVSTGIVTITAEAENGVRGAISLYVLSSSAPTSFVLSTSSLYLNPGETHTLSYTALPAGAVYAAEWYSSDSKIAKVNQNGKVTAVSAGSAVIGVRSLVNPNITASCKVTVLNPNRTLVMPARRTATGAISTNLNRISNILSSATEELESLRLRGAISSSEKSARLNVIKEAFSMYSFPWMTLSVQPYWKEANSENGAKDFKPGIVYYGLPYTQIYSPRMYNTAKALSENRYYKSSGSYYILNQNNLISGNYCGNDCSSMITMAYFGPGSSYYTWNTKTIYSTTKFTTLSTYAELRPGDILVRSGRHVVMFLYYANSDRSQIVIIEQGGTEAGINTISASIQSLSSYYSNSYIPRRYANWSQS